MKKIMIAMVLIASLTIGALYNASANLIGWQTTCVTEWQDDTCTYRETCQAFYVLFIPGPQECCTETIECVR